jgi:drug/metabolite transporter (DMT)-like permease
LFEHDLRANAFRVCRDWVWLAFQEVPSSRALVGGALVMGAVIADIISDSRAQRQLG